MVVNDTFRKMEEANKNHHNIETNDDNVPEERTTSYGKHHSQTSAGEECVSIDKETEQPCVYKPLTSPMLRKRKQPISMFEVQPNVTEIIEVQEICIETGTQQWVKESVIVLPDITSSTQISDETKLPSELHTTYSVSTTSDKQPEISDSCQERKVVVGKDNGWIGSGSKLDIRRIPTRPATSPVSPSIRRRSLGVLRTPAWGLRTYRDPDKIENKSSPSLGRRSLVFPVRHVQGTQSPCSPRRKSLVSPDITELTTRKDCMNCSQLSTSAEDLRRPNDEKQLDFENNAQDESHTDINNSVIEQKTNSSSDDTFEDFRPRLRSRSLDDSRTVARENVLQHLNRGKRSQQEPSKPREGRRKSFEVWLTEKEQETIRKLQMLALEKRASEDEVKRKEQRKGKTYDEWLNEKNNMVAVKDESSGLKQDETTKQERQENSKRRYHKWLMEKEMQALEEEQEMLKEAKLKTIEMRKKYEERKKSKFRFLKSSLF